MSLESCFSSGPAIYDIPELLQRAPQMFLLFALKRERCSRVAEDRWQTPSGKALSEPLS